MSEVRRSKRVRKSSSFGTIILVGVIVLFIAAIFVLDSIFPPGIRDVVPLPETTTAVVSPQATTVSPSADATPEPSGVTPSAVSTPTLTPTEVIQQPLISIPSRLVYEAAGIDLSVAPMDQVSGPFAPPAEKDMSYWLTHRPGYILAHSAELEKWPFNALTIAARPGDLIKLTTPAGVVRYEVTDVTSYPKHYLEIDGKTPVWDIDDRLLRLIGCKDGDVWDQVTVVTATVL